MPKIRERVVPKEGRAAPQRHRVTAAYLTREVNRARNETLLPF